MSMVAFASENKSKQNVLPSDILSAIESSDSIKWILLDPMALDSVNNTYAIIGETLTEERDTCEERINALKSTLTYSKSFENTNLSKDCTFLPDVACVFSVGDERLVFSYSFYCDQCRFEYKELKKEYGGENIRDAIIQIVVENFPKDRYLRKIAGKTR